MKRTYVHLNEAWYRDVIKESMPDVLDDLILGIDDNGCYGEFRIEWTNLDKKAPVPQLKVFDDAWKALAACSDLISELAALNDTRPTPEAVIDILKRLGFEDETERDHQD